MISYCSTDKLCNADICSRFPLEVSTAGDMEEDLTGKQVTDVFLTTFDADKELLNHRLISKYTRTDKVLSKVIRQVQEGWMPTSAENQPYRQRLNELSVEQGCLLWGARVVVPEKLRSDVLDLLHATHAGIVSMKAMSRSYFWWPGLNNKTRK